MSVFISLFTALIFCIVPEAILHQSRVKDCFLQFDLNSRYFDTNTITFIAVSSYIPEFQKKYPNVYFINELYYMSQIYCILPFKKLCLHSEKFITSKHAELKFPLKHGICHLIQQYFYISYTACKNIFPTYPTCFINHLYFYKFCILKNSIPCFILSQDSLLSVFIKYDL